MKPTYDWLIVGAGLYGAVFAHEMSKQGKHCLVLDRRCHVGGNAYTHKQAGITVHTYGAHIFHTDDPNIWDYINQFASFNHYINAPIANYQGEIYNLPFNMNTFNKLWGVKTPAQAQAMIAKQSAQITHPPRNLEEQAISLVGHDIYHKLIKGYTEKQWNRPCTELPAFIIKRLPVRFTYDNNYFNDRYQGIPIGGYTPIIEKMLANSDVQLGVDYLANKERYTGSYRNLLYTGMIDEYYAYTHGQLDYRSLRFETEALPMPNYQGNAVVNYTGAEPYTRIIEHKHFEFGDQPTTVISREYPTDWRVGLEPYYPLNNDENQARYERYAQLASQDPCVIFGGRLGSYRYYDMHQVIAMALIAAREQS